MAVVVVGSGIRGLAVFGHLALDHPVIMEGVPEDMPVGSQG